MKLSSSPPSAKIDLRGEKSRASDLVRFALRGEYRQRCGQRRSGDAIADGVDVIDLQTAANRIDRIDLRGDIIVPDDIFHRRVGGFPRHHEHGDALIDAPFDEAFFCGQIEDVETVDPRREDDQRRFQHLLGRRLILQQLIERRLVNDFAGRCSDILAQPERVGVGMGQLPALHVVHQMLHPRHQARTFGLDRFFQAQPDW